MNNAASFLSFAIAATVLIVWADQLKRPPTNRMPRWLKGRARLVALFALPLAAIAILFSVIESQPFTDPKIAAGPYDWPSGCPVKGYRPGDWIPRYCKVPSNALSRGFAKANGFNSGNKGGAPFYRVGN